MTFATDFVIALERVRGFVPPVHESHEPLGQFLLGGETDDPREKGFRPDLLPLLFLPCTTDAGLAS
jgi:hypothetical protein